jgi:hypothetical protein
MWRNVVWWESRTFHRKNTVYARVDRSFFDHGEWRLQVGFTQTAIITSQKMAALDMAPIMSGGSDRFHHSSVDMLDLNVEMIVW